MKIDIERLGLKNVSIDPETIFTFSKGLAGFESYTRFKLFHEEGKPSVFWLGCLDEPKVMFPVVAPEQIDIEYQIELPDEDCELIGLVDVADAVVLVIVYRDAAQNGKIAANTRSPVILNLKTRQGMQKILRNVQSTLVFRGH